MNKVDCIRCQHYQVTWDPERPMGCRAFGFKTASKPSDVVRNSSGRECELFTPKQGKGPNGGAGLGAN